MRVNRRTGDGVVRVPLRRELGCNCGGMLSVLLMSKNVSVITILLICFNTGTGVFNTRSKAITAFFLIVKLTGMVVIKVMTAVVTGGVDSRIVSSILRPLRRVRMITKRLIGKGLRDGLRCRSSSRINGLTRSLEGSVEALNACVSSVSRAVERFTSNGFGFGPRIR